MDRGEIPRKQLHSNVNYGIVRFDRGLLLLPRTFRGGGGGSRFQNGNDGRATAPTLFSHLSGQRLSSRKLKADEPRRLRDAIIGLSSLPSFVSRMERNFRVSLDKETKSICMYVYIYLGGVLRLRMARMVVRGVSLSLESEGGLKEMGRLLDPRKSRKKSPRSHNFYPRIALSYFSDLIPR